MATTQPQATCRLAGAWGFLPRMGAYIHFLRQWNLWPSQPFSGLTPFESTGKTMTAGAAFAEVSVSPMPPDKSLVSPRLGAEAELESLLAEIPLWDDHTLLHMYRRYGESRLFRVHHDPAGALTNRAECLRVAAREELALRGLAPKDAGNT